MKYASFPLPPLVDSNNAVRCRCHKMLVEMMIIYERIIETLQQEDIKRPPVAKKKSKSSGKTNTLPGAVKMGRPSRYTKDIKKPCGRYMDKQIKKVKRDVEKDDKPKAKKDIKKLLKMDKKFDAKLEKCDEEMKPKSKKKAR